MSPQELIKYLTLFVEKKVSLSAMIWGAPGIGKSSIVNLVAKSQNLQLIDLRLSQLAPTDLRGLPVAEDGVARWFPPEFLPRAGTGILFLDEINMATPAMQGIAQQLILDRQVGNYKVPDGWFIWAAGNRKSDRAAVFEMPSALANRFVHLEVTSDFDSFRVWALNAGLNERMLAFLAFRPALTHQIDPQHPAWPSPRTWVMADQLYRVGLPIDPAVGIAAAGEFESFCAVYQNLPDMDDILEGKKASFPKEPSARYAVVLGLIIRADNAQKSIHALRWLVKESGSEWVQFFATDLFRVMRERGNFGELASLIAKDESLKDFASNMRELILHV